MKTSRWVRGKLKRLLFGYGIDNRTKTINLKDLLDELEEVVAEERAEIAKYFEATGKTPWLGKEIAEAIKTYI